MRQGDTGDRFYVIDEGSLEVVADGQLLARREPGECVGEIALLRDQPRMATVRTVTRCAWWCSTATTSSAACRRTSATPTPRNASPPNG